MKKILSIVCILFITVSLSAQKKKKKPANNDCYLTEAASTFNLSEEDKSKLKELLTEKNQKSAEIKKSAKAEEITKEEFKQKSRGVNRKYASDFAKLAGKSKKEINLFVKGLKGKCSKKKKKKKKQ